MAWTLGITNETAMALAQNEMEHTMYKSTQQCVSQLTATASQSEYPASTLFIVTIERNNSLTDVCVL